MYNMWTILKPIAFEWLIYRYWQIMSVDGVNYTLVSIFKLKSIDLTSLKFTIKKNGSR